MKKKAAAKENPLEQPLLEHFQPIEEEQDEDKGDEREVIPPLRHPYPPFWEEWEEDKNEI